MWVYSVRYNNGDFRILGARMTSSFSPKHSATNEDGSKVSRETESSIIASSRLNHFYGAYFSPVNEFGRVRILRRDLCAQRKRA
jgi:hypothetical protein